MLPFLSRVVTGGFGVQPHHNTRSKTVSTYVKVCVFVIYKHCHMCIFSCIVIIEYRYVSYRHRYRCDGGAGQLWPFRSNKTPMMSVCFLPGGISRYLTETKKPREVWWSPWVCYWTLLRQRWPNIRRESVIEEEAAKRGDRRTPAGLHDHKLEWAESLWLTQSSFLFCYLSMQLVTRWGVEGVCTVRRAV